jgi:iron complex transport system ATP-binding protein
VIALALDDVGVSYGRRTVLEAITVAPMRGGEVVAVIGPNAAGKSTLFRRIAGLTGGPGEVRISGRSRVAGRAAPMACYLPQDTAVNAVLTVYESLLLAIKGGGSWSVGEAELARIDAALKDLEIEALAMRGLGELSGGQRQLVSIAQTLAREPDILLLDEPTSALDLHHQFDVLALVRRVARQRGICVLIAIHDLNQAMRIADRALVLDGGRVAAEGRPMDVVTPELLASVYGVKARLVHLDAEPFVIVEGSLTRAS